MFLFICSHQKYSSRKGTHMDVKSLIKTFGDLGFNIAAHDDLDYDDIMDIISNCKYRFVLKISSVELVGLCVSGAIGPGRIKILGQQATDVYFGSEYVSVCAWLIRHKKILAGS